MAKRRRHYRARVAEDVLARAARLDITPERVLREYARIAFSNIRQVVAWDDATGITVNPSNDLAEDDAAAVAEIVAAASSGKIYRIKMHDKKPVLDSLARHLDMLPALTSEADDEPQPDGETPQQRLIRAIDRLEAERAARSGDLRPE